MVKKVIYTFLVIILLLNTIACGQTGEVPTADDRLAWQEQYDLGIRYLSEGNYKEAIIAFTTAIEIDPKQAPAYVGRGDAYVLFGETDSNLAKAQADYEKAIELDETLVEAYLGLADVYIQQGDKEAAITILEQGFAKTGADDLIQKLNVLNRSDVGVSLDNLNVYGVTEFTKRRRYVPFNQLSDEIKGAIDEIIPSLIVQDVDALLLVKALSKDAYEEFCSGYTEWGDYRVYMGEPPHWTPDLKQYRYDLEIRPQDGMRPPKIPCKRQRMTV